MENQEQRETLESSKREATGGTQGVLSKVPADVSADALEARRQWAHICKVLKGKKYYQESYIQLIVLMSFKSEGETKTFLDKQKLREFITTRLALQEMLKGAWRVK